MYCDQSTFSGPSSFCAYNYPRAACELLVSGQATGGLGGEWIFVAQEGESACNVVGEVGFKQDFYSEAYEDPFFGGMGACILSNFLGKQDASLSVPDDLTETLERSIVMASRR